MKKLPMLAFPPLFALLPLGLFLLLYRPGPGSAAMTSACLVFLTAVCWSALIVFGRRQEKRLKVLYAASTLLASLLLVWALRPFAILPAAHGLMVALQALGAAGIVLYLRILKNKGE